MVIMSADIDIDFGDRSAILKLINHTLAMQLNQGVPRVHNSGVYITDIPKDPINNFASIEYNEAERRGYFKIDFLNMGVYQLVQSPGHYQEMIDATPPWDRLWQDPAWTSQLVHVGNYTELLRKMQPKNIPQMAAFISIIRPGKAHLQNRPWEEVFATVWDGNDSLGYTFKKSNAISYAALVALHMNLLNTTACV
jgi:hypothetical protein